MWGVAKPATHYWYLFLISFLDLINQIHVGIVEEAESTLDYNAVSKRVWATSPSGVPFVVSRCICPAT